MLAIILIIACVGFYAFIGTAPDEAVQIMVFLFWATLIVGGFAVSFYDIVIR